MANNPDFKEIIVKDVELQWPRLDQPYRFNDRDQQTESCAASAPGAAYSVSWKMPIAEGKKLWGELKAHYEACRERNAKLPEFSAVFGMKKDEEAGTVEFRAKKNAMTRDGDEARPPRVVGPDRQDLENKAIWSGSRGHVRALAFPATNPQDKSGGVTLLLDIVQVTDPKYGGVDLDDVFGPQETVDDPFAGTSEKTDQKVSETATAGGF